MIPLNFPSYPFKVKNRANKTLIFDIIRKKYIHLTLEEWVRQHCITFLLKEKKYPISLINVEKMFLVNDLKKKVDIVVFDKNGQPFLLVECKSPHIKITQKTFDQIAIYNLKFKAPLLYITNGIKHFYCKMDFESQKYIFLKTLPLFT